MQIINLGSRVVNTYLIELKQGLLLIDTGYPEGFKRFKHKLQKNGIGPGELRYILLTHAHDDHAGFLNALLGWCEAKVILHTHAAEGLRRGQNSFDGGCTGRLAQAFCKLLAVCGKAEHRFQPVDAMHEDRYIFWDAVAGTAGETLERELGGRIIVTPGHTACSLSLLLDTGEFFCGDAAMNGFPSIHRTTIWAEDLDAYATSWEKIISLRPGRIYPGHGAPFPVTDLERFLPRLKSKTLRPLP